MKKSVFDRLAEKIMFCPGAEKMYSERVKKALRMLYPSQEIGEVCKIYYCRKTSLLLKIICAGTVLISLLVITEKNAMQLTEKNGLQRAEFGETGQTIRIEVQNEHYGTEEVMYEMVSQCYTPEQIEEWTKRFLNEYEELIRGENESLQNVHTALLLEETYESYPMEFEWETSDYSLIGDDGEVKNEELQMKQPVQLTVHIRYEEVVYEHVFTVCVIPPKLTPQQQWRAQIVSEIQKADQAQKYQDFFHLPKTIDGKTVRYHMIEESSVWYFILIFPVVVIIISYAKDRDLNKETEIKKKRMSLKYPEFVSKFQLLLGAGMTVRNICIRLSEDKALGEDLREEMELVSRDMRNGMSVKDALDRFGRRTANPLYIKFSAMVIQNLKKGTDDLQLQLSSEVSEAFVFRKNNARQLGEEAGTKLLIPMMGMLVIVMAVLIIPAFLSFQI